MIESDPIPTALAEIAAVLRQDNFVRHPANIDKLRSVALSSDPEQQKYFRYEITVNKYYWMGMGTIADLILSTDELNWRFMQAYFDLATACEAAGLGSVHSRGIADSFGRQLRERKV